MPPALRFLTATTDEMIPEAHGAALAEDWGGPAHRIAFEGGHNTPRPPHVYESVSKFLSAVLQCCLPRAAACPLPSLPPPSAPDHHR